MHQLADNDVEAPNFIPLIWQGDGPNPSPNYSGRGTLYGVSGIPHSQWQGHMDDVGGGTTYPRYLNHYNELSPVEAPMEIATIMNIVGSNLEVTAEVTMTDDITTTNNKMILLVTYDFTPDQTPDYFASVTSYEEMNFPLTSNGETGMYTATLNYDASWDLTKIHGVAIVQTFSGDKRIHQAGITAFSGLVPLLSTNITEGPASLGVQFRSISLPQIGIDTWEWDFDGDGVYDSTEEDPYYLYEEEGVYDVTLRIGNDGEYAETTVTGLITVTDASNVSGIVSGVWTGANGPYFVSEDIEVAAGDQLTLESGTDVFFAADAQLLVHGKITADASDGREGPIDLTAEESWKGILISNSQEENKIIDCRISKATESAIAVEGDSHVEIIRNRISENSSTAMGAAINIVESNNVLIRENIIANNFSLNSTGGIVCDASIPEITNNVIANNTGTYGAFILKSGANVTLVNNTIANNESTNGSPFLFYVFQAYPEIENSIIIDDGTLFFAPFGDPVISYTCLTGGFDGTGNIDSDPMFTAPTAGNGHEFDGVAADWTLADGSPCIDTGNPAAEYNDTDGSANDMGAYGGPNGMIPTSIGDEVTEVAVVNSLRNYPNPFNPVTNIAFNVNVSGNVVIEIYNSRGQKVSSLTDDYYAAGEHNIIWDGTNDRGDNVASGIYLYKMKAGGRYTSTKKMILLK